MGVAQTFAGLARVDGAPDGNRTLFQRLGHGWPFYVAGGFVALVGIMAFQVDVHPRAAKQRGGRSGSLMNEGDRIERLEARMAALEELVAALRRGQQGSGAARRSGLQAA